MLLSTYYRVIRQKRGVNLLPQRARLHTECVCQRVDNLARSCHYAQCLLFDSDTTLTPQAPAVMVGSLHSEPLLVTVRREALDPLRPFPCQQPAVRLDNTQDH